MDTEKRGCLDFLEHFLSDRRAKCKRRRIRRWTLRELHVEPKQRHPFRECSLTRLARKYTFTNHEPPEPISSAKPYIMQPAHSGAGDSDSGARNTNEAMLGSRLQRSHLLHFQQSTTASARAIGRGLEVKMPTVR
jgi:hypothetical protein